MGYGKNDKVHRCKHSLDAFWLIGIFFLWRFDTNPSDVLALQGFGITHFGHTTLRKNPLDQ